MKKILTATQMKECDHSTIAMGTPSSVLMQRAANAVFSAVKDKYDLGNTLVICGSGNNGGDGLLVALALHKEGHCCDVWYVGEDHAMTEETESRYNEALDACITFVDEPEMSEYTLIIDAVFGTGLCFAPEGKARAAINAMNSSECPVVSVDIPSGISADTGEAPGAYVIADTTVTMQAYKRGHTKCAGLDASGRIICADLGIDTSFATDTDGMMPVAIDDGDLSLLPRRKRDSNKGTFGRVLVIAGSMGMCGAAYLSAAAAYRTGAGIVEIFTHESNRVILQTLLPEAIVSTYESIIHDADKLRYSIEQATVIVIGPGIGKDYNARVLVRETYDLTDAPIIIDADALNVTAMEGLDFPTDVPVIVTPHPGELSRLTGKSIKALSRDTWRSAMDYAREKDIICVSKFARTVITDGENVFVNMSGGPSLSKGGSGDVLTGVIAGMLASGLSPIGAASIGAYVHGRAGDITAERSGDYSPLARDVIDALGNVLKNARGKK